jgi:hypothetical protein
MQRDMQRAIILTAMMTALSATGARADEWCGYTTKDNTVIECGYTTAAQCESAVGKGGLCFVDPDVVRNEKHAAPAASPPSPTRRS